MSASACIVDIGSGSVGVSILTLSKEKPVLSKTVRIPIGTGTEEAKEGIVTLAGKALEKALSGLTGVSPKTTHVVLAAPWYDGKITTISSKSEKPVKVTNDTIMRTVTKYLAEKGLGKGGEIESVVSQLYVNGYPTRLSHPVVGTALRVHHFTAEADSAFAKSVKDIVLRHFPNTVVSLHSFMFAAFASLREWRDENNFLIVDVGSEITDVAIAHRDGLRFIATFPVGAANIARTLAGKGSIQDARSRLALFAKGELSEEESASFAASFESAAADWKKGFQNLLETAVKEVAVPQTTFLFGDREELEWLPALTNGLHGSFSIRAIPVTPDFFHHMMILGEGGAYDSFLSAEAAYFSLNHQELIEIPRK